ncbi:hypothetical protein [Streptomyces sp. NPDC056169]|uniref:hypothetical protein n=1 Tax=Streptomyces sp. NPDC056169 TaxID=3345734 RepID=UPI0035DA5CC6
MPKTPAPTPPLAAVAQDAHWTATLAKLRARTRPTAILTICDDDTARRRLAEARQRHARAQLTGEPDQLAAAEVALAAAQATFDDVAIVLTFQALPRTLFEELKLAHPPTEAQAEDGHPFNVETLGPELISTASLDGLTVDDARTFLTEWAEGEATQLFHAAWDIQDTTRADLGKG